MATTVDELRELTFPQGMPGFPDVSRFALVRWGGDDSPFSLLRSLDDPSLEFLVVPPSVFFPDYAPELGDETVDQLDLTAAEDAVVLVLVTVAERADDATANLLGPIVVNRHTRSAVQAVLATSGYGLREPLIQA
jgi:flagellar assembly factor FliW